MKTYQDDKIFLSTRVQLVELSQDNKRLLLAPTFQGRVFTSSASGDSGYSFGWINYKLLESGKLLPHCNNFGGEDRYWLGPEGGQYAIFFKPGSKPTFDFEDWQAPSLIDTDAWAITEQHKSSVSFTKSTILTNYSNTKFNCKLDRRVSILSTKQIADSLGVDINPTVEVVGFTSENKLTNIGKNTWNKKDGGLSIWILGQFIPSDQNHVIIPFRESKVDKINDIYFGKIDADRLEKRNNVYYFKCDGYKRGKIGIPPQMTYPIVFSLDEENNVLTIVKFSFDSEAKDYINSLWAYQEHPYQGDVINSYNDGPLEDGSIMGPFYEIENSSKALFLKPDESYTHVSNTIHLRADLDDLKKIMDALLQQFI
ncbi:MAG: DUF6786 family protein [Bacteroidaceae bacterium]|nr:hypothetical protein [Bacteroidaceae bacterium]